jgi:hypothetical protein
MHLRFIVATVAATLVFAPNALAGPCGLPDTKPLWVDYAESSVDFRDELFRHPGLVLASSGTTTPQSLRDGGAHTVYWQMKLMRFVGTPSEPAEAGTVAAEAADLLDRAAASSGCATPLIALNEMQGVTATSPLSASATQYRINLLTFVQHLAERGATPFVLLPSNPNTIELDWWQQLAESAYLVREVYQAAPKVVAQGAGGGSRAIRVALRTAVTKLTDAGISSSRVGLMLGFHSGGNVGRAGLQPQASWLQYVKLSTLAAKQVASELSIGNVWVWGWGVLSAAGADADKPFAACVSLWARDPALCDAPALGQFDTSVTDGQLSTLPPNAQCVIDGRILFTSQLEQAQELLGDRNAALTALLDRLAASALVPVTKADELAAERRLFPKLGRFLAATKISGVTAGFARGVIVDELRYARLTSMALVAEQQRELAGAVCRNDEAPAVGHVRLATKLPFLRSPR